MGWPIRMYSSDGVYFVSARTVRAHMFFRPSNEVNEIVGGVLAKAVQRYGIEVYGFVFLSNHLHLIVRVRDGVLSRFMQYLLANLARKVGRLVGWSGPFWEGRFCASQVLDDTALIGRLGYVLAHGVKEGLVAKVSDWPGLSCLPQLLGESTRTFRWFSWARNWLHGKRVVSDDGDWSAQCAEEVPLTLSVLPCWQGLPVAERRRKVLAIVAAVEDEARRDHPEPLGVAGVLETHPHHRPADPKKSRRPICHASDPQVRREFIDAYRAFVAIFRQASERFRNGELLTEFPRYAFRPPGFTLRLNL